MIAILFDLPRTKGVSGVKGECDDYRNQKIKHKHLEAKQEGRIFGRLVQKIKMKLRRWNIYILTLVLLIAVSHECTQSQSIHSKSESPGSPDCAKIF